MQNVLIREGYLELLTQSADENKYLTNQNRMKNFPVYMVKQENAKGIIFDHLATKYFDKVSSCITVREVLEKLGLEFKISLHGKNTILSNLILKEILRNSLRSLMLKLKNSRMLVVYSTTKKKYISYLRPYPFSICLLYTSPSPRDRTRSRMPSSA